MAGAAPYASDEGAYLNFEADADERRVRASYGEQKYHRLAALKAEWDPDNLFRRNPNIPPAAAGVPVPRVWRKASADQAVPLGAVERNLRRILHRYAAR